MSLSQFIVKQYVSHLGSAAKRHKGFQTATYSQCLEPVNSIIGKHAVSREGVCEATSAKWIVLHAHGSSLFNWIYDGNGKINRSAVVNLAFNQIDGETRLKGQSGKTDQDWASERYLFSHGIQRRSGIIPQNKSGFLNPVRSLTKGDSSSGDVGNQLAAALGSSGQIRSGFYVMIGIHGSGGGHCMAAYIGEDICFFDPNFGEYWFPKRSDFVDWFRKSGWLPYRVARLNKRFALREYAPKMGFVAKHGEIGGHLIVGDY